MANLKRCAMCHVDFYYGVSLSDEHGNITNFCSPAHRREFQQAKLEKEKNKIVEMTEDDEPIFGSESD